MNLCSEYGVTLNLSYGGLYSDNLQFGFKQEFSYRQPIARQLRTQYVEGIYRHKYYIVTLKSRLRVTQGH